MTVSPKLYKKDRAGNIRFWQFIIEGPKWATITGIVGGAETQSGWTHCTPKNVGKKNATTAEEQAIAEAYAAAAIKMEGGMVDDISRVDEAIFLKPMLAQSFDKFKGDIDALISAGLVKVQPKLDGIRCVINAEGMWTRTGKPILGAPHIFEEVKGVFSLEPDLVLDGELYNHVLKEDFNTITSIVRKQKPSDEELRRSAQLIQFHNYDGYWSDDSHRFHDLGFHDRFDQCDLVLAECGIDVDVIVPVEDHFVYKREDIAEYQSKFIEEGYEGLMVRVSNERYDFGGRSWSLMKYKNFDTEEFPIVAIEEGNGNWKGFAKKVFLDVGAEDPCGAGIRGNQEFAKRLLEEAPSLAGRATATVRFQGRTPDGYLRFPVVIDIQPDGKRVD